jgi:DNA-binding response OmpR family regulator
MKRRVLLVDDEVSILLTLKAVLEISGFTVDTAASAREGKMRIKSRQYDMIITDMRMEQDESGADVIACARTAPYHPAVALLSAYPVAEEDWQNMGADQMLVKPMQMHVLLRQLEALLVTHEDNKLKKGSVPSAKPAAKDPARNAAKKPTVKKATKKVPARKTVKSVSATKALRSAVKKTVTKRVAATKKTRKK